MRTLCSSVLVFEAVVVLLAIAPALALTNAHHGALVWGGLAVAAGCVLSAALLRGRAGYVLGSVVQVAVVAAGFVLPAMFFLGGLFAALWVSAILLARRAERLAPRD
ncbi:MAG: DUF4233 domain-containing protein [Acidimicrobiales bacterium]